MKSESHGKLLVAAGVGVLAWLLFKKPGTGGPAGTPGGGGGGGTAPQVPKDVPFVRISGTGYEWGWAPDWKYDPNALRTPTTRQAAEAAAVAAKGVVVFATGDAKHGEVFGPTSFIQAMLSRGVTVFVANAPELGMNSDGSGSGKAPVIGDEGGGMLPWPVFYVGADGLRRVSQSDGWLSSFGDAWAIELASTSTARLFAAQTSPPTGTQRARGSVRYVLGETPEKVALVNVQRMDLLAIASSQEAARAMAVPSGGWAVLFDARRAAAGDDALFTIDAR